MSDGNPLETVAGLATLLGIVVIESGGEIRVPAESLREIKDNKRTVVNYEEDTDEIVIGVLNAEQ